MGSYTLNDTLVLAGYGENIGVGIRRIWPDVSKCPIPFSVKAHPPKRDVMHRRFRSLGLYALYELLRGTSPAV